VSNDDSSRVVIIAVVIVAALGGGFWWWRTHQPAPPPPPVAAPAPPPAAPPAPPPPVDAGIQHPLDQAAPSKALPSLDESDDYVKGVLSGLLGKKGLAYLVLGNFIRNTVATVDNLARERATPVAWPVNTTPGAFETDGGADAVIAAKNAARYAPFVRFVTAVDTRRAVALYRHLYPLFQQAYKDLGVQGKYFNDRLVQVIDNLLDTPELVGPVKVKRIQIPVAGGSPRESSLYAFADPALEARSAGQKILMRVGPDNAAKLKAKLLDIRSQIASGPRRP